MMIPAFFHANGDLDNISDIVICELTYLNSWFKANNLSLDMKYT